MNHYLFCFSFLATVLSFQSGFSASSQLEQKFGIPRIEDTFLDMRNAIPTKVQDLWGNFRHIAKADRVSFLASRSSSCATRDTPVGQIIWGVKGNQLEYRMIGCGSSPLFTEFIGLKRPLTDLGKLPGLGLDFFQIKEYKLYSAKIDRPLVQWMKMKNLGNVERFQFSFANNPVFTLEKREITNGPQSFTRVIYNFIGFNTTIEVPGRNQTLSFRVRQRNKNLSAEYSPNLPFARFFIDGIPVEQKRWLERFGQYSTPVMDNVKKILKFLIDEYLPKTTVLTGASGDTRFLDELRDLRRRMDTLNQANELFIRTRLQFFINSIEKGQIRVIDERP